MGKSVRREFSVSTRSRTEFINIDSQINQILRDSGIKKGVCHVFIPHTTAAITINENADPNVVRDILMETEKMVPFADNYRHLEGNSDAHIKASLLGFSETVFVEDGRLLLGTWQSIYFCEFDGPRRRRVWVMVEGE